MLAALLEETGGLTQINHKYFVNFTKENILSGLPRMFTKDALVIELLEDVVPCESFIRTCLEFKAEGYTLALDDFVESYEYENVANIVDVIKVDFLLTSKPERKRIIDKYSKENIVFLAEKVETEMEFKEALDMGFHLFQGYFFSKPQIVDSNNYKVTRSVYLLLLKELSKEEPDLDFLSKTIKQDFTLTLKLLKIVNSPVFYSRRSISSIKESIVLLGIKELRRVVSILMIKEAGSEVPEEVAKMSLLRGYFSEKLSIYSKKNNQAEECFIMGVLSLIDVMLKRNIADALENFPVSDLVYDALVSSEGELVDIICFVKAYERGLWKEVDSLCNKMSIDQNSVSKIYFEAVTEVEKIYSMVSNSQV